MAGVDTRFAQGIGSTSGGLRGGSRARDATRDEVHLSCGRNEGREKTAKRVKCWKRYQGTSLLFTIEDYNENEGRPHLDKNGIHNVDGS